MKSIDVLKFFGSCGMRFDKREIVHALSYFEKMMNDNKVVALYNDGKLFGILIYSVTNDEEKFLNKNVWDYLESDPNGKVIVIHYLACLTFDYDLRNEIRTYLKVKHPQFEYALWWRQGKENERLVKVFKEKNLCIR